MTILDSPLRGRFGILGGGALLILLLGTSAYSIAGLVRERRHAQDLAARNETLLTSLRQMQNQVQLVSEKLNAMAAPPTPPVVQEPPAVRTTASPRKKSVSRPKAARAADDSR